MQAQHEVLQWVEPLLAAANQRVTDAEAAAKARAEEIVVLRKSQKANEAHIQKLEQAAAQNAHKNHNEWDLVEQEVLQLTSELREAREALSVAHSRFADSEEGREGAESRCAALQKQNQELQERCNRDEEQQMERCSLKNTIIP